MTARKVSRHASNTEPSRRRLIDLVSVGPATLRDLSLLGIDTVDGLACCEAAELYDQLCRVRAQRLDPCCQDVFSAAIAQARDPDLPPEKCRWWYWSSVRKRAEACRNEARR